VDEVPPRRARFVRVPGAAVVWSSPMKKPTYGDDTNPVVHGTAAWKPLNEPGRRLEHDRDRRRARIQNAEVRRPVGASQSRRPGDAVEEHVGRAGHDALESGCDAVPRHVVVDDGHPDGPSGRHAQSGPTERKAAGADQVGDRKLHPFRHGGRDGGRATKTPLIVTDLNRHGRTRVEEGDGDVCPIPGIRVGADADPGGVARLTGHERLRVGNRIEAHAVGCGRVDDVRRLEPREKHRTRSEGQRSRLVDRAKPGREDVRNYLGLSGTYDPDGDRWRHDAGRRNDSWKHRDWIGTEIRQVEGRREERPVRARRLDGARKVRDGLTRSPETLRASEGGE
jgi:hypothetical protein